ncbi:MAG: sulfite exporter TauE/SafE family protein [Paralcaligenes sp.]
MEWYIIVLGCLISGALIGFTGGVLGIGGGLLAIPLLGLVFNMPQQAAQGTALIMVLPAVLITVRKYNQYAKIDLGAAAAGAAGSIVFTWLGARFALGVDPTLLRRVYAIFILGIAIFYFHQSRPKTLHRRPASGPPRSAADYHRGWFALVGVLAGSIGGIFGVGGSVVAVPFLTTFFRLPQTSAQALAMTTIIPGTCVALLTYSAHGQAHWMQGIPLAMGSIFCIPYGVRLAYSMPEPRLKRIFSVMLLVIMFLLLMKA